MTPVRVVNRFFRLLLRHPLQRPERGLHVGLRQADQQTVVFHPDLVDGLAATLLQTPLQLRGQMLEAILGGVDQLQLRRQRTPQVKIHSHNNTLVDLTEGRNQ